MTFRYPCISSGYAGILQGKQTLNARFYASMQIDDANSQLNEIIQFPQRIPRAGLFDELYSLETPEYKQAFHTRTQYIRDKIKLSIAETIANKTDAAVRHFINFSNLALRHGDLQSVMDHVPLIPTAHSYALEIELLKETTLISLQLSSGATVSTQNYQLLAENYLSSPIVSVREKIMLLNQMIVASYRYEKGRDSKTFFKHAKDLLNRIEKHEDTDFNHQLHCSIGYRGLAMVAEFGENQQEQMLKRAEEIALTLYGRSEQQNALALENLYTCLQSVAKWHISHQDNENAEVCFKKMIEIDPVDSTGHSELGLHYIQRENYTLAAEHLKSAMLLGPPGTAMNAYYYAKCIEITGKIEDSITYLIEATTLDESALSPWIDLFEIYKRKNDIAEAKYCANHILSTQLLRTQLNHDETNTLQSYIS